MENTQQNQDQQLSPEVPPTRKALDFYHFFRSGNHNELCKNLSLIASNPDLDKKDLALLVLMLRNGAQPYVRRLVRGQTDCTQALQKLLTTVRDNESRRGMRPFDDDVAEIERIIYGPPLSPDIP